MITKKSSSVRGLCVKELYFKSNRVKYLTEEIAYLGSEDIALVTPEEVANEIKNNLNLNKAKGI